MSDEKKLVDGDDELERTLLGAARDDVPSHESVRGMLAAAGVSGALTAVGSAEAAEVGAGSISTTASATAPAAAGLLTVVKWAGIGVVTGTLTVVGLDLVQQPEADPKAQPTPKAHTPRAAEAVQSPKEGAPAEDLATVESPPAVAQTASPRSAPPSSPSTNEPTKKHSSLAEEALLIDGARAAVSGGNGRQALSLLDRHAAEFPHGELRAEARYLRMEALVTAGQMDAARSIASGFVGGRSNGAYSARARVILGGGEKRQPTSAKEREHLE